MSIKNAYNLLVSRQGREVTYKDVKNNLTYTVKIALANFFRDFAGPEEVSFPGREYVIAKDLLTAAGFTGVVKKNHQIIDADLGTRTIEEVREMIILGEIVGYRVRTN